MDFKTSVFLFLKPDIMRRFLFATVILSPFHTTVIRTRRRIYSHLVIISLFLTFVSLVKIYQTYIYI